MEKVLGIGGFFFRARDAKGLARWYEECLGVDMVAQDHGVLGWQQQAGRMASNPLGQTGDPQETVEKMWMLNFRVRDMDAMVRQLRAHGVAVTVDPQVQPNGLFAQFSDPEGNPVMLWEALGVDARD